ncbi:glycosyltransferase/oxidoreductase domain-containing protein [Rhizobium gallicum]|uniref:Glycosyltransferase/oxidoreductase domain-containing protein n=2 Tax=Rhizobium gallicum TaxID=56730 RepID=A0A1L5NL11_9HYPH|nr:glycosyltransferase [Rhizobium gallicum]APO68568.1 glycosyltransferase/oxidoreductase domain-containing protein [Rhizobium gallicum]
MTSQLLHIVIATDSREPSGMGEHMLTLGQALGTYYKVTLAAPPNCALLTRAVCRGLAIKDADDPAAFEKWLCSSGASLLHIHAGIGWEGHEIARVGCVCGIPVIRTEHLPYLLTDAEQIAQYHRSILTVAHHIVVSEASRKSFERNGVDPARLTVVRNGIYALERGESDADGIGERALQSRPTLLTVARFSKQKDHAALIRAMPTVVAAHPTALLLLVGEGEEMNAIQDLVDGLALRDHVQFLGHRNDVANFMMNADLFVLPSRFEGLPLAVLEAMSVGLTVVATRIGGTIEALGEDHPFLAEPENPSSLADVLIDALSDPIRARSIGQSGMDRFHSAFSADRMATETVAVYQRFLPAKTEVERGHPFMEKTRIGFIGVGGIARRHLDILTGFDDVALVAFADPDLGRASEAASRFGAKAFTSHQAMLDDEALDAVYICIPPFAHGDAERDLIRRDVPFFVEKPITLDLALAEELAAMITGAKLITAVGYHWRYLDTVEEARRLLVENPAQLLSGYWLDQTPPPQWWWKIDRSGGQMIEQTTHIIDLARYLIGEVTDVYGRVGFKDRSEFPGLDVPAVATATMTFESGVIANISSTCLLGWNHRVGLNIFADRLAIELTDHDIMVDVGAGRPVRQAEGDPVWREDRDFVDAVRGQENHIRCAYSDALATHRIALAVAASARQDEPVKLDPPVFERRPMAPLQHQSRKEEPQSPPPGHRRIRSLGIERAGKAFFLEYEEGPPADGHIRLETLYSGFSAGTELTFMKNTNPYFRSRFDGERGVFVEGEADLHYPVPFLGYMEVARVSETRAAGFANGDVVATTFAHKSGHTADPCHDLLVPLPIDIDPVLGVFVAQMGPIAANGILHADSEAFGSSVPYLGAGIEGRNVVVLGAGTVGLMTALFAQKCGASNVIVADPSQFRQNRAHDLGLAAMEEELVWQYVKARWHNGGRDRGADVVFQTRAQATSLHTALKTLRPQGTVIDLAFYQGGAQALRLGEEFHHNGLNIRCAQINRVPRGLGASWDRCRLAQETVGLMRSHGSAIRDHMITHVVPFDDAPQFLADLVTNRPEFLQIVFKVQE